MEAGYYLFWDQRRQRTISETKINKHITNALDLHLSMLAAHIYHTQCYSYLTAAKIWFLADLSFLTYRYNYLRSTFQCNQNTKTATFWCQAKGFFLQKTMYIVFDTCLAALHIFVWPLGRTSSCNDATSSDKIANYSSLIPLQSNPGKPRQPRNYCKGFIVD